MLKEVVGFNIKRRSTYQNNKRRRSRWGGVDLGGEWIGEETVDEHRKVEREDYEVSEVEGFCGLELFWCLIHGG